MLKDGHQILRIEARRYPQNPLAIKTAVRTKAVAIRVKPQRIPKCLDRDDRPRHRTPLRNGLLQKHPQSFLCTATQFRKKRTIIKKITPEDLGDAEDEMPVGNLLEHMRE